MSVSSMCVQVFGGSWNYRLYKLSDINVNSGTLKEQQDLLTPSQFSSHLFSFLWQALTTDLRQASNLLRVLGMCWLTPAVPKSFFLFLFCWGTGCLRTDSSSPASASECRVTVVSFFSFSERVSCVADFELIHNKAEHVLEFLILLPPSFPLLRPSLAPFSNAGLTGVGHHAHRTVCLYWRIWKKKRWVPREGGGITFSQGSKLYGL